MSNLSCRQPGSNPGPVEGAQFSRDFPRLEPPEDVTHRPCPEGLGEPLPRGLLRSGAKGSVFPVADFVLAMARKYRQRCTWVRIGTIAGELGMPKSTVRMALNWLVANRWFDRERRMIDGEARDVYWIRWLLPDGWANCEVQFPLGVRYRPDEGRLVAGPAPRPRARPRARGADPCAEGAGSCAQETAPKQDSGIQEGGPSNASGDCVARLAPRGEDEDPGAAAIAPAAPPCPDPARVAELVALLDAPPAARPGTPAGRIERATRLAIFRDLAALAGRDPDRLAPYLAEFGPPPAPEPARPRVAAAPAPPRTAELIARLADPRGPEAVAEACRRLARDFEAKDREGSPFRRVVERAAAGEIPIPTLLEAYAWAMKPGAKSRGAVFNGTVNRMTGARP